ncbi:hypothetical protein AKJ09_00107 [Labilithrix luteola]|uniref:Uncharacterized protein n=1 Tax=Labilithrix luteola TaxID=1391654 RepID=A0A0K1PIS0_9BACT|nr:hypothetical protein [Labilithrix luteola]AKU93443.1 hypothetical protein AKJ09_00107 [Labilithrix luteola]
MNFHVGEQAVEREGIRWHHPAARDGADSGVDGAVDDKSVVVRFANKYGFADGKVIEALQDRKNTTGRS